MDPLFDVLFSFWVGLGVVLLVVLRASIKLVPQNQAYVIERFGKYRGTLTAGLNFIFPLVDRIAYKQSLKEQAFDVPSQSAITNDNIGLASGIVLFAGIGALVTGIMLWLGWLPDTWLAGIASFGISAFVSAVVLWKPLLKLQNYKTPAKDNSSDLIGYTFHLQQPITTTSHGSIRYSGVEWRVEIDESCELPSLEAGHKSL